MVEDFGITLKERDFELKELDIQKLDLFRRTKRDPLTLKLQDKIARRVGAGNVNLESKRLTGIKKRIRRTGMNDIRKQRESLMKRKIKEEKIITPIPIEDPFGINLQLDSKIDL